MTDKSKLHDYQFGGQVALSTKPGIGRRMSCASMALRRSIG
jgi:hypothetical protein